MKTRSLLPILLGVLLAFTARAAYVGIHGAAASGDLWELANYLDNNTNALTSRNGAGRTPLCIAALNGRSNAVDYLIGRGADVNDLGFEHMTPLADMASPWGLHDDARCAEIATILLAHGAKLEAMDDYGQTPLLWAAESGKAKLVQVLLEKGADLSVRCPRGMIRDQTALHLAVNSGSKAAVEVLLKFKAALDAVDYNGSTPLNLAEGRSNSDIADLLRAAAHSAGQSLPPKPPAPPTKEAMRALAQRIAQGDDAAFAELIAVSDELYRGIKDYQKERPRVMLNLFRMKAAFDVLGTEAGKGNDKALAALKKSLKTPRLSSFAPDAIGVAAAGGSKEALDMLIHYDQWGMLDTTAQSALCEPVKAGVQPALDYFATWLGNLGPGNRRHAFEMDATNALATAAANGNARAQYILDKFVADHPENDR